MCVCVCVCVCVYKDANAGKDWRQKAKGAVEDEMVR